MERIAFKKQVMDLMNIQHKLRPVRFLKQLMVWRVRTTAIAALARVRRALPYFLRSAFRLVTVARTIHRADRVMAGRGGFQLAA